MWNNIDKPLILASNSPRRRELLARMGFVFTTRAPEIQNETVFFRKGPIRKSIQALATAKAESVAGNHENHLVFGADTVVFAGGKLLGKPESENEARKMLTSLSGRTHRVYSGVALCCRSSGFSRTAVACTTVRFRKLRSEEIERYLDTGEYADKAGAYGIQGNAMCFVDKITGCYYNVVGLPVTSTIGLFASYQYRKEKMHV